MTLVHDTATRMFLRNVKARSGNAPVNKLGRKPARYDIPEAVPVLPAAELLGEVLLLYPSTRTQSYFDYPPMHIPGPEPSQGLQRSPRQPACQRGDGLCCQ